MLWQGSEAWNQWRHQHAGISPNLAEEEFQGLSARAANLRAANLEKCSFPKVHVRATTLAKSGWVKNDLRRADLKGANLNDSNLDSVDLSQAILVDAQLRGTRFGAVNLQDANLSGAYIFGSQFRGTNLRGSNWTGARLHMSTFVNVDLRGAQGLENCEFGGPSVVDHTTLTRSGPLPLAFLRGCGLPENFIEQIPPLFWEQPFHYSSGFIRYSHRDLEFARRLQSALEWRRIRCWRDEKELLPGQDIYEEVDRAIRDGGKLLLCCSEASLTSWWVDNEIGTALEQEQRLTKELGRKVNLVIPVDLDGYIFSESWKRGYRAQIRRRVAADFTGWRSDNGKFDEQLERIVQALRADGPN